MENFENDNSSENLDENATTNESEKTEDSETSKIIKGKANPEDFNPDRIIKEQSFDVSLNDWGKVRFVSCEPDHDYSPTADFTFYLLKDNKPIYKFPSVYEDDDRGGLSSTVDYVAFKDINANGKDEIIIGSSYCTGAGPTGAEDNPEVRIFEDNGEDFIYDEQYNWNVNDELVYKEHISIDDVMNSIFIANCSRTNFEELFNNAKPSAVNNKVEGEWSTDISAENIGSFTFSNESQKGFHFNGYFLRSYGSNSGKLEGDALYVNDSTAIYQSDKNKDEYIGFFFTKDGLVVVQKGLFSEYMDEDVSAQAFYTKQSKRDSNAINKIFTKAEISEIKGFVGEDIFEKYIKTGAEVGPIIENDKFMYSNEEPCKVVRCIVPSIPLNYKIVFTESNKIYFEIDVCGDKIKDKFYTNDEEYTDKYIPQIH